MPAISTVPGTAWAPPSGPVRPPARGACPITSPSALTGGIGLPTPLGVTGFTSPFMWSVNILSLASSIWKQLAFTKSRWALVCSGVAETVGGLVEDGAVYGIQRAADGERVAAWGVGDGVELHVMHPSVVASLKCWERMCGNGVVP